jgi:hypothetical protein
MLLEVEHTAEFNPLMHMKQLPFHDVCQHINGVLDGQDPNRLMAAQQGLP